MNKKSFLMFLLFYLLSCPGVSIGAPITEISSDLAQKAGNKSVVEGADGWFFLKEELTHVGSGPFWGDRAATVTRTKKKQYADPLPAIIAYNKLLADQGITLYLMPVPPKATVYFDKLKGVDKDGGAAQLAMYKEFFGLLTASGVNVIDLLPTLLEAREKEQLYCKTDTHFSGSGIELFAGAITDQLKQANWFETVAKKEYFRKERTVDIHGDLAKMAELEDLMEPVDLSFVTVKESGKPEESDPRSPVILMGDSHALVFSAGGDLHAKGAGLFDNLSATLGFPVDLLGVRGSGVTPARIKLYQRSKKDGDYLKGKKVLIWCFTARDFTGTGGWRDIPVAP